MAKIQNVLYNTYFRPYSKTILIVFMLLLFVVVGVYLYRTYVPGALASKNVKNVANANVRNTEGATGSSSGTLEVMLFNVDWCPHCVKAKPDWIAFVQKYDGKVINGYQVTCVGGKEGVNCTNADDPSVKKMVSQYKIQGYPTLKFIENGTTVDFDAKINTENMDNFMKNLK